MNRIDVPNTLRDMWETRPARPRDDRQVAGVASAIARRYDIDPVLVRVGFVVAAFSGIGAGLYIAGWILLPEEPADPAAPAPPRSPRGILLVALVIAAIAGLTSLFGSRGGILLPLLAVAALLFLLHHTRGDRVTGPRAAATPPSPAADSGPSMVKDPGGGEAPTQPVTPPAWDPLGAAPFAWDLPEPGPLQPPAPPPVRPRRLPVTSVTLGLALLAGGLTSVILLLSGAMTLANLAVVCGVTLSVLGAGLVFGAFVRAGRALIPFALLLSALTWGVLAVPTVVDGGVGDITVRPSTVAELQPNYQRSAGDITLDLRRLDLAVPGGGAGDPLPTSISLGAGDTTVWLPANADVTLRASTGIGSVSFAGRTMHDHRIDVAEDLGADGVRSGRLIVLDIEQGLGDVEVHRG